MKEKKSGSWAVAFSVASVWFGTHVGSGFATGTQGLSFFAQYGWTALLFPTLSMLVVVAVHYIGMHGAIYNGLTVNRQWANWLYHPYEKVFGVCYDVVAQLCGLLAVAACLAGCGTLCQKMFGLPYMVGVLIFAAVLVLTALFGFQLITRVSSGLTILLVACLLIVLVLGISHNSANLSNILSERVIFEGQTTSGAISKMIMYACFQASTVGAMVSVNGSYKTSGDIKRYAVIGFILNTVMLTLSCLTVLSGMPEANNALPILTVCQSLNMPWVTVIYQIVLMLAYLSTGVTITYGNTKRFSLLVSRLRKTSIENVDALPTKTKAPIAVIYIVVNIIVAQVGLLPLINKGYSYMGIISLFFYVIPSFTIGVYKMRRDRKRCEAEHAE